MDIESAKPQTGTGTRLHVDSPPRSHNQLFSRIFNTVLPRSKLTHRAVPVVGRPCPPHHQITDMKQSPLVPLPSSQLDPENQHQDLAYRLHRGEMKAYPAPAASAVNHEGWSPWSPEHVGTDLRELNHDSCCLACGHREGDTLLKVRYEPFAANLPAYYDHDPALLPSYHDTQNTPNSCYAIDMPLHKSQPELSILNNDSGEAPPPPPKRNPKRLTMSKTSNAVICEESHGMVGMQDTQDVDVLHGTKQHDSVRKGVVNVIRLRPNPSRPERSSSLAQIRAQPSPLGSHPVAMKDTSELPMPPVPPKNARRQSPNINVRPDGKDRPFDVDPADQHKTNVRRPPKGIQHWFDAYISSDDDDDGDDESNDGHDYGYDEQQPQELPADELPRPVYNLPQRCSSLAADSLAQSRTFTTPDKRETFDTLLSPIESDSSNSIQSSHCRGGRRLLGVSKRVATMDLAQQSVLSTSSSDYSSNEDDDDFPRHAPLRDSIRDSLLDDRNFEYGSAASIRLQRLSPPEALHSARVLTNRPNRSMGDIRSAAGYTPAPRTHSQHASVRPQTSSSRTSEGVDGTLRRLNGFSSAPHSVHGSPPSVTDAAHMVAVTDEEMIVLEMMRKKRAEMQQASFTEVLQRKRNERDRNEQMLHGPDVNCSKAIMSAAERSPTASQLQLNDMRKAQSDAGFEIKQFLGMSSPSQPTEPSANGGLMLPATFYTPKDASNRREVCLEDQDDLEAAQRRVEQFIATQGAVPPLNSIRTMRRPSNQALSPTRAVELAMPPIAPLRKLRTSSSGAEAHGLQRQVSAIRDPHPGMHISCSPVSAIPSYSSSDRDFPAAHAERPRTASAPVNQRGVAFQRSLPRINTDESLDTQRHALNAVLEGWSGLGGGRLTNPNEMTSQQVQT